MLMLSVSNGHKSLIEYLLQRGADINLENSLGRKALDLDKSSNYSEIEEILENKLLEDNSAGSEC